MDWKPHWTQEKNYEVSRVVPDTNFLTSIFVCLLDLFNYIGLTHIFILCIIFI